VKRSQKTFISLCFEAKQSEKRLFRFALKQNKKIGNKTKQKFFGSETKQKYAVLISLWSEAINSKRKEAKKNLRERAKKMRNGSHFALFASKRNIFFCETGTP
jgi:hypothetical protein